MNNIAQRITTYFSRQSTAWWSLLFFLISTCLYWPSLRNGFVWDDLSLIADNTFLQTAKSISTAFSIENELRYRPLFYLSLLLDYKIWGLRPFGYHLGNIMLHAFNTVLLFRLLLKLFSKKMAIAATLIFTFHAVNTEAVDWILNRSGLLSSFFSLISLNIYFSARNHGYKGGLYPASLTFYIMAILTKETAIVLPVIIFLYELLFSHKRDKVKYILYAALPLSMVTVAYFWWWTNGSMLNMIKAAKYWGGSPFSTFLLMMKAFSDYIRLMIFPLHLRAWYIPDKNISILSMQVLAGISLLALLIVGAIWFRTKRPVLTFSIFWFLVGLLPVSNIIPITGSMMAERWLYFPMIGFCIAAGAGVEYMYDKKEVWGKRVVPGVVSLFIIFLALHAVRVYERHKHWLNTETMFKDLLAINPDWAPGHNVLAAVYVNEGRYRIGLEEVLKAIKLDPDYPLSYETLGSVLIDAGRLPEAEAAFRKFYELKKDAQTGHVKLSIALMHQGKFYEAKEALETARKYKPNDRAVYINFGYLYYMKEEYDKAEEAINKVFSLSPEDVEATKLLEAINVKRGKLLKQP